MLNIAIISLSNGLDESKSEVIENLKISLEDKNIKVYQSHVLYKKFSAFSGTAKERANALEQLFMDKSISAIFDISGGDLANEIIPFLNFEIIRANYKPFFGYSDLSVLLNSIYSQTNKESYLYQLRNISLDNTGKALSMFIDMIEGKNRDLFNFDYKWIQGNSMNGIVIGGNLRCTLKLSGTPYMPSFENKLLLIESLGGDVPKIVTYLNQYKMQGAFNKINGIILGTFTEMERDNLTPTIEDIIVKIVDNPNIPIIKTNEIGHSSLSKAIIIGKEYSFK